MEDILETARPAAILVDEGLQGGARELVESLRAKARDIRCVLIRQFPASAPCDADVVISKPVSMEALRTALEQVLEAPLLPPSSRLSDRRRSGSLLLLIPALVGLGLLTTLWVLSM